MRSLIVPFLLLSSGLPVLAQPMVVDAPTPPSISMPSAAQAPFQSPTVDDVMTLGRPPAQPTSVGTSPPVLQRPAQTRTTAPDPSLSAEQPAQVQQLPPTLSGTAQAFDGNTLVVDGAVVVLDGADAPELGQLCLDGTGAPWNCGEKSFARLSSLVEGRSVVCEPVSVLEGGYSASCRLGKDDVGSLMVREGLAVAFVGNPAYRTDEASARSSRRGVWSGSFDLPWVYRTRPVE